MESLAPHRSGLNGSSPSPLHDARVLIVDPEEAPRERLSRALRDRGLEPCTATDLATARERFREQRPARVLVELRFEDGDGLDLVRELAALDPRPRVVVWSGWGSIAATVAAVRCGANNVISKPADAEGILAAFDKFDWPGAEGPRPVTGPYVAPTLARMEWEHIQRVLSDTGGNISESARRLGIHRRSLQRKLQRLAPPEVSRASTG